VLVVLVLVLVLVVVLVLLLVLVLVLVSLYGAALWGAPRASSRGPCSGQQGQWLLRLLQIVHSPAQHSHAPGVCPSPSPSPLLAKHWRAVSWSVRECLRPNTERVEWT